MLNEEKLIRDNLKATKVIGLLIILRNILNKISFFLFHKIVI